MGTCPDPIKQLIDHFDRQRDQLRSPDYSEALIRIDFINPLMTALGWDIDNTQRFAEQYREVVHEDRVKVAGQTKAPDYSFRVGGQRKFFLEAKKPAVDIKTNWEPAYQLRRYAWSAKLAVSILTDFEEFAIYDTRVQPRQLDKASTARREFIRYTDYPDRWDFLEGTFSKAAVYRGDFDRYCESKKGRGAQPFDDAFLSEIEDWRSALASNLALRNDTLDAGGLNFAVQRIIDRIIFLRIAEDRGTERTGQLSGLVNGDKIYERLQKLFHDADVRYNSGLFHFVKEKDRDEQPDTLTPGLEIDDKVLKQIIKRLYYPESPYEFTMVSADILGSVYERFLGKIITLTPGHRARIEEKPEVRKAGGVYYTPTYIVDYIVRNTVGKLLGSPLPPGEGQGEGAPHARPSTAKRLRVLDPACGSGSFLIGAYGFLLDWYLDQYRAADPATLATGKNPVLRPTALGDWALTINARKRILLDHIHGVDIDAQAVEVTKLNLLLKCLEGETSHTLGFEERFWRERALPDLGKNIQCGNSLIGTDIIGSDAWNEMSEEERRRINPFDYERAFPQVFKGKDGRGFDAVIGNPPYIRMEEFKPVKDYLRARYHAHEERADLYAYFIERGRSLIARHGVFSMIVSNKFIRAKYGLPLRSLLSTETHEVAVVDLAGLPVFSGATVRTIILSTSRVTSAPARFGYTSPPSLNEFQLITSKADGLQDYVLAERRWTNNTVDAWRLQPLEAAGLVTRVRGTSIPLAEYLAQPICYGVKSGLVEAFVLENDEARPLRELGDEYRDVVRPLIAGREIKRYEPVKTKKHILYIPHDFDARDVPRVVERLRPFKARLEARATKQAWYELQQPQERYVALMARPKIVYPDIAKGPRFTLDIDGKICADTAFALPTDDLLLLALLNSRFAAFYFAAECAALEGAAERYLRFKTQYVEDFPVPGEFRVKDKERLTSLVTTMLTLHQSLSAEKNPHRRVQIENEIAATDRQIDQLVYQLYGLADDEIKIVEEATT